WMSPISGPAISGPARARTQRQFRPAPAASRRAPWRRLADAATVAGIDSVAGAGHGRRGLAVRVPDHGPSRRVALRLPEDALEVGAAGCHNPGLSAWGRRAVSAGAILNVGPEAGTGDGEEDGVTRRTSQAFGVLRQRPAAAFRAIALRSAAVSCFA